MLQFVPGVLQTLQLQLAVELHASYSDGQYEVLNNVMALFQLTAVKAYTCDILNLQSFISMLKRDHNFMTLCGMIL